MNCRVSYNLDIEAQSGISPSRVRRNTGGHFGLAFHDFRCLRSRVGGFGIVCRVVRPYHRGARTSRPSLSVAEESQYPAAENITVKLSLLGILLGAVLSLLAVPTARAQSACVSVSASGATFSGTERYVVTNHCTYTVEGVVTTKLGGSFSFGPLARGQRSLLQSTATGAYRVYVCNFPRLPRIAAISNGWIDRQLPRFASDPARVSCQ